ncbi:MAG: ribose 5-phosphate isomerase B [candidate division Zixibacteria bacterium]|nr:ribose 5-phosphate isomerase B [Candidatus Tariuqbacter arcticus]
MKFRIAIAADHAGFRIKEAVKKHLTDAGYEAQDFGTHSVEMMDYPDAAHPAVRAILKGECDRGILICGTGLGMQLVANHYAGIRATLCWNTEMAELARRHNDANVLTMPGRFIDADSAIAITDMWLKAPFDGGRHARRVGKIERDI